MNMAKKVPIVQATFYNNNTKHIENCYPMTSAKGVVMSDGKTLEESFSDKADNSVVVHKSGDEEILGRKTFDVLRANEFSLSDYGNWNRWVNAFYSFLENKGIIQFGTENDWSVILRNIADPEYENDAATKGYVDIKISSTEETLVHKDGYERITERKQFLKGIDVGLYNTLVANEDGVQSGAWLDQAENPAPFIVADPSADDHAATKLYVDKGLATKQNTLTPGNGISIKGNVISSTVDSLITPITYAELVALRNSSSLVAGMQYRITDYACTTIQENTQSAGHPFDIIVTADSENTLNEEARAIQHQGDTYFADCDLNAWKIWYCLDNDNTRFAWADSVNGKGVIYRMIDEWNNDVPYDFKNIMFNGSWGYWAYTFNWINNESDNTCEDLSVAQYTHTNDEGGYSHTYGNIIKPYGDDVGNYGNPLQLNVNVFLYSESYDGGWFYGCYSNTFGDSCYFNTFGDSCYSNTFGNYCQYNTFGNSCSSNTFGSDCSSNTFGNSCYSNTFGNSCSSNTFGNSCYSNTFGNSCSSNTFGNSCSSNTFGNNCSSNTFGNNCSSNTFGNNCYYIRVASTSSAITKYNYYRYNHFGDGCQYILFKGAETASSSAQVQNYNFAQGVQGTSRAYLTIDGVRSRAYETKVAKNSSGVLKIYCEADLIQ